MGDPVPSRPGTGNKDYQISKTAEVILVVHSLGVLQSFTAAQLLPSGAPIRRGSRESRVRRQY